MGASDCCGVFSLLFGTMMICLFYLLGCIAVISSVSSVLPMTFVGVTMSPGIQVVFGSWALIGIPIIVGAGVGALYRVESNVRLLGQYLAGSLVLNTLWWGQLLFHGTLCSSLVSKDVQ